jgi:hypothetical protein
LQKGRKRRNGHKNLEKEQQRATYWPGMEAHWYGPRHCRRVWIPARLSEDGKRSRRFFETKDEAEKFVFQIKRRGSVQLADLSLEELHVLGVIRQSEKYAPKLLLEVWQRFEREQTSENSGLTVQELTEKFLTRQKAERRSIRLRIRGQGAD